MSLSALTVVDRGVYVPSTDSLVVADLHVGRAEASNVSFPLDEAGDLRGRLTGLVDRTGASEVVVAGDVLHQFGAVTARASESLDALAAACREAGAEPVLVRGNHDTALPKVWDGTVSDSYRLTDALVGEGTGSGGRHDVLVCHGHERPGAGGGGAADLTGVGLVVVGHDHPAIEIEGKKRPCFLYGPHTYDGASVLMLPAFTRLAGGVTVNRLSTREFQSPLVTDADALRPVVYDADAGEALTFPPLGDLRRML